MQRMVKVPAEEYEALQETVEILKDREIVKSIKRGLRDIREGRTVPHSEIRRRRR